MTHPTEAPSAPGNFIRELIAGHLASGTHGGRVVTRFPPEPNGYLHVGHAKSICLNFGLAEEFGGECHLRMDDTNPTKEDEEYVASIAEDVRWLGFRWTGPVRHASDYFPWLYEYAEQLIVAGKAYVCSQSEEQMRADRGTISEPGRPSPYRERSIEENLRLFREMRAGKYADGEHTLRGKIDMAADNMKLRDPPLYRIRRARHHRTGDAWCLYPLYDFAHCLSDAVEGITHSVCTLEFENNRALYDWVLESLPVPPLPVPPLEPTLAAAAPSPGPLPPLPTPRPRQYEFARLMLTYTVLSKRKLLELVRSGRVSGWDDPRMPTLSGMRRRGVTPEGLRAFCEKIGVSKNNSVVEVELLEACLRDDLNQTSPRALGVVEPLKLTLTNVPEDFAREFEAPYFPPDVGRPGARTLVMGRSLYIDREDFTEAPPSGWKRLAPGAAVRLRYALAVRCEEVVKGPDGELLELRCVADLDDRFDPKSVRGTLHWVDAARAVPAELRLYGRLFSHPRPDAEEDYLALLDPASLTVRRGLVEPSLASAAPGSRWQLERVGFFCADARDSRPGALVLNRTVPLKDSWAKQAQPRPAPTPMAEPRPRPAAAPATLRLSEAAEALAAAHGLSPADAHVLADDGPLRALFIAAVAAGAPRQPLAKLLVNELRKPLEAGARFEAAAVVELLGLLGEGALSMAQGRELITELAERGGSPRALAQAKGYGAVDDAALTAQLTQVLEQQAALVARYRAGETKLKGALVGAAMRQTGGKLPAPVVTARLEALLDAT